MIALVPVRRGAAPPGSGEAVAEAGGAGLLAGDRTEEAAGALAPATRLQLLELGDFAPARWAAAIAPLVAGEDLVLLPASPDGRDLAPRLAHLLGRPLLAGAVAAAPGRVVLARHGGRVAEEHRPAGPAVATLVPGCRGVEPAPAGRHGPSLERLRPPAGAPLPPDAEVVAVSPPDPETMDLAEAERVVAGGGGLGGPEAFTLLRAVASSLGAVAGATRVATDAGWAPPSAQIGTTGVSVDPRLYVALGVSGAVQHVAGLGRPRHVVAVNLDRSCPMMTMADLAVVADAPAVLAELARRLGADGVG